MVQPGVTGPIRVELAGHQPQLAGQELGLEGLGDNRAGHRPPQPLYLWPLQSVQQLHNPHRRKNRQEQPWHASQDMGKAGFRHQVESSGWLKGAG